MEAAEKAAETAREKTDLVQGLSIGHLFPPTAGKRVKRLYHEYLEGLPLNLDQMLKTPGLLVRRIEQVIAFVENLSAAGLVHGNLKMDNLLWQADHDDESGIWGGYLRAISPEYAQGLGEPTNPLFHNASAPEIRRGEAAHPSSDIYTFAYSLRTAK